MSGFSRTFCEQMGQICVRLKYLGVEEVLLDAVLAKGMSAGGRERSTEVILADVAEKITGRDG